MGIGQSASVDQLKEISRAPLTIASLDAIDCDVHPRSPRRSDLLPYLDAYWRDILVSREIDLLELTGFPENTRPNGRPGVDLGNGDVEALRRNLLEPLQLKAAILNVVSGIHAVYDPYLSTALCQATNRWLKAEWLDRDPRLRASLLVPFQNPEAAAAEIEAYAQDKRFVQVLTICMGEHPLGRRLYWPIYQAAAKHGFALAIHAGTSFRHAPTQSGFNSYLVEDFVHMSQGFGTQVSSLLAEGVLAKYADMKIVLLESGVTWVPGLMWRLAKDWRGVRIEVPWVKEKPTEIIRRQVRMSIQPFDGPDSQDGCAAAIRHLGDDGMILYASDFPHDHRQDIAFWPERLPQSLAPRIARTNALATYPRLEIGHE